MASLSAVRRKAVMCVKNDRYAASLRLGKIYAALPDPVGGKHGLIRVIDETGEDCFFPRDYFAPVAMAAGAKALLQSAA
jgi:hypothetical protein